MLQEIEVTSFGVVQVVTHTSAGVHRHCVAPGQDYSQESAEVQAACAKAHTPAVIVAYQELIGN